MQNGSCGRVFNFAQAKQKDGSQVHPLSIILEDYKVKVVKFGCEGETSENGTSSARTQSRSSSSFKDK
ncbi:MAG: hypothetical protein U5N85_10005 [Arcicella sp.]|nr:hypothetical protein [Arcicella sp.]